MAQVILIDYTGRQAQAPKEYAGRLLAFTKNTRLNMNGASFDSFMKRPWAEVEKELKYMSNTIPSSWEFVDVYFLIQNISRAAAQQMTRTRNASFAMQSQRVLDVRDAGAHIPPSVPEELVEPYAAAIRHSFDQYSMLVDKGVKPEDARGILPINAHSNLVAKYNLRALVELIRKRKSIRVQGEYRDIVVQMERAVNAVWPWAEYFFEPANHKAIALIEDAARQIAESPTLGGLRAQLAKAADLLKI